MRWLILLLALGCVSPTAPERTLEVWFQDVPIEHYSRDPGVWYAIQAHAIQTPADTTFWQLDAHTASGWVTVETGTTDPGLRAGHRWYINRSQPIELWFTARGRFVGAKTSTFDFPGEM